MARRGSFGDGDGAGREKENLVGSGSEANDASVPDIGDLLHDDAFLDALAQGNVADDASDDERELAELLLSWREDIVSAPLPEGPTLDDVEHALRAGAEDEQPTALAPPRRERRSRWLTSVAGAAAAAAFVVGGVAVLSQNAMPGDPLWGVREAIHGGDETTVLVAGIRSELEQAERALESGDVERARAILESIAPHLETVDTEVEGELTEKLQALRERAERSGGRPEGAPVTTTPKRTTTAPKAAQPTGEAPPVELPTISIDPEILRTFPLPPITEFPVPPQLPQPGFPQPDLQDPRLPDTNLPLDPPPVTIPPEILREIPLEPPQVPTLPEPTQLPPPVQEPTTQPTPTVSPTSPAARVPTSLQVPVEPESPTVSGSIPSFLEQLPSLLGE